MPEVHAKPIMLHFENQADASQIAEVARIVHFLKKHAVGKTIAAVKTQEDDVGFALCRTTKEFGLTVR